MKATTIRVELRSRRDPRSLSRERWIASAMDALRCMELVAAGAMFTEGF